MAYQKPVIVAENKAEGKYSAGCPAHAVMWCKECERSNVS